MNKFCSSFLAVMMLTFGIVGMAGAVELLDNPGFEAGLTGWSHTANVIADGERYGISPTEGSLQAVMSAYVGALDSSLSQGFSIDPTLYTGATISFDYNLKAVNWFPLDWGTDSLSVSYNGTEILNISLEDAFGGGATELGWTSFSENYSAIDLGIGPLTVAFHVENAPPGGGDPWQALHGYIDNVSIDANPIPEPGTMLLLGFGLLGLAGYGIHHKKRKS
jgi:hypothetical protein